MGKAASRREFASRFMKKTLYGRKLIRQKGTDDIAKILLNRQNSLATFSFDHIGAK
jgi:hypothetical protein